MQQFDVFEPFEKFLKFVDQKRSANHQRLKIAHQMTQVLKLIALLLLTPQPFLILRSLLSIKLCDVNLLEIQFFYVHLKSLKK
jgi:hypothetical protein